MKQIFRFLSITSIIVLSLSGFRGEDKELRMEYYNSLRFLKKASAPEQLLMIMTDVSGSKSAVRGTLFTYQNRSAKSVKITGNFSEWHPEKMERSRDGIWYYFLGKSDIKNDIKYKFMADGIWISDPKNPDREDDGTGSYLSIADKPAEYEGTQVSYRLKDKNRVEFRVYSPKASFVSVVGDFNRWNPENDLLKKGKDGIWRIKKRLSPGSYRYKFVIDGEWTNDIYNSMSASDDTGSTCSMIKIN